VRHLLTVICCAVSCWGWTSSDAQPSELDQRKLAELVAARESKLSDSNAVLRESKYLGDITEGLVLDEEYAQLAAYSISAVGTDKAKRDSTLATLRKLLQSDDPRVVGLACQIAELGSSFELIPDLGKLLDDKRVGPACQISYLQQRSGPSGDPHTYFTKPSLSQMAALALRSTTGIKFESRSEFDAWYRDWDSRHERVWYWLAKWRKLGGMSFFQLAVKRRIDKLPILTNSEGLVQSWDKSTGKTVWVKPVGSNPVLRQPFFRYDPEFSAISKTAALDILLKVNVEGAAKQEAYRIIHEGDKLPAFRSDHPFSASPIDLSAENVSAFIKDNKLQNSLIEYLKPPADDPSTNSREQSCVPFVLNICQHVLSPGESNSLLAIQNGWRKVPKIWELIVLSRSRIDQTNAQKILKAGLAERHQSPAIIAELAKLGFEQSYIEIFEGFSSLDPDGRWSLTDSFRNLSANGPKIPIRFFKEVLARSGDDNVLFPSSSLANLADCLNATLGKQGVPESTIAVVRYGGRVGKGGPRRPKGFHEEAVAKLKQAMLAAIASEKTN